MTSSEINRIEKALGVRLPTDYRQFLKRERDEIDPDDVSILDDPDAIIVATNEYRIGFSGLPSWPGFWVYVGDESDACPYCIDCDSKAIVRLHKGDLREAPLASYQSFSDFLEHHRNDARIDAEADKKPLTWRDTARFYMPAAIGLFIFFIILPLVAFSIKALFQWLIK